ncbi:Crp/Fnr family transcriptional regulator [uncultured Hoeflea sp.]|uniref:Crp/Fnr family transcriptional regulator n=1 Tax=uncultured Hoeflea sp. TaxID=538666 RepID=UPI0026056957|nr:Crp/Fnr family transcriptional regulator [uncultured Hoeflea sp.]
MLPEPFQSLPVSAITTALIAEGAALFRRDDPGKAIFLVQSGGFKLLRYTRQGDEIVIHRAGPGESFAEAALFSPRYHCDAIATADARVIRIEKPAVLKLMRIDPEFALAISARFAGQIQDYRRRLEILAIRDAESRVFAAMADGFLTSDIKTLAAQIGLTHEAVYRALAVLVRKGRLIKTGRGAYALPQS